MDINVNKSLGLGIAESAKPNPPNPNTGKPLPLQPAGSVQAASAEQAQVRTEPAKPAPPPPEPALSEETVARLNDALKDRARELEFSVDDDSGRTIVRVIHKESGEVIRQLPPEVVLRFAEAFTQGTASLLEEFA
ncbi:flagellar protein FlaG [Litorivivens sp.]|uniref:flagellar protein FlaG n=1 Tax=Litorivivens sp. TaxID=2020868 RepID=UPI0035637256